MTSNIYARIITATVNIHSGHALPYLNHLHVCRTANGPHIETFEGNALKIWEFLHIF
jgi:hypothetical protein